MKGLFFSICIYDYSLYVLYSPLGCGTKEYEWSNLSIKSGISISSVSQLVQSSDDDSMRNPGSDFRKI